MTEFSRLGVEVVSDDQALEQLGEEWKPLADRRSGTSVFYWYDWLAAAWQWKRHDGELATIVVRFDGVIVGILPLVRRQKKILGLNVRYLDFLAIPDTQECDVLCLPGHENVVASAIVTWLDRCGSWDMLRIQRIPGDSFILGFLVPQLAPCFPFRTRRLDENLALSLRSKWDEYYARRSRRLKKGNNLVSNRLAKNFSSVEVVQSRLSDLKGSDQVSVLQDLCAISEKSWKDESTDTTFVARGPKAFLQRLVASSNMREHIVVWRLLLDSECVATELHLEADGIVSALRSDFDNQYSKHSPGTFLNKEIIQRLFGQDLKKYRMGPGSNAYKLRWSEESTELSELSIYASTAKAKVLFAYREQFRPFVGRTYANIRKLSKRG